MSKISDYPRETSPAPTDLIVIESADGDDTRAVEIGDLPTQASGLERVFFPGPLVTQTGVARLRFPEAVTILGVSLNCNTAPTGASIVVDVNKNGTTIWTTQGNRPAIAASGFSNTEDTDMDVTAFAAGDYMTVDIDQVGSSVAGSDLVVTVRYEAA